MVPATDHGGLDDGAGFGLFELTPLRSILRQRQVRSARSVALDILRQDTPQEPLPSKMMFETCLAPGHTEVRT